MYVQVLSLAKRPSWAPPQVSDFKAQGEAAGRRRPAMQWLGCCFFAQALFWGVIWALKRPKEQERKRMQWRRAESRDPALPFLRISLRAGCPGACEMGSGPRPRLTKLTGSRHTNNGRRFLKPHNSDRLTGKMEFGDPSH